MYKFNIENIEVVNKRINRISSQQGGIMMVLDEDYKAATGEEKFHRERISVAIARDFAQKYKRSTFLEPAVVAVTYYHNGDESIIVSVELKEYQQTELTDRRLFDEDTSWLSNSARNASGLLREMTKTGNWFIDGTFVYRFLTESYKTEGTKAIITKNYVTDLNELKDGELLTADGKFVLVHCEAYKLQKLSSVIKQYAERRTSVGYVADENTFAVSPPVWKDLFGNMSSKMKELSKDEKKKNRTKRFDYVNDLFGVSLNFALKAGKDVGKLFGYDKTGILRLHDHMIRLHTVNLPKVPKELKSTYDIGITFNTAMVWMIGLCYRSENLSQLMEMRNLIKFLSQKGIFRKDSFNEERIYKKGKSQEDVKLVPFNQAAELGAKKYNEEYINRRMNIRTKRIRGNADTTTNVGGLVTD